MQLPLVFAIVCCLVVGSHALEYSYALEPHSLQSYNTQNTFLTISNATTIIGVVNLYNGGCILATFDGVPKYIRLSCSSKRAGNVVINTYNPETAKNCIGQSDQFGEEGHLIDDNSRLGSIYGASTTIRATCRLPLDLSSDEMKHFRLVEQYYSGVCPSSASLDKQYALMAAAYFRPTNGPVSVQIYSNLSRTVQYPCTNSTPLFCNNTVCSVTTDPDVYYRPVYAVGPFVSLDDDIRTSINVVSFEEPSLMNWPNEKDSIAALCVWIVLLTIYSVNSIVHTIMTHPIRTSKWNSS